jgi:hypothetical protein
MPDSPSALRVSLRAARANLGPGLALQAFAGALVAAYFLDEKTRAALDALAGFRERVGLPFALVSTACFGGLLPALMLRLMPAPPQGRHDSRQVAALTLFWAYKGWEVSFFYGLLALFVGEGRDFGTIATKTFIDQCVYSPFFTVPCAWFFYFWVENRFALAPVLTEFRRPGWFGRLVPLQVAGWGVWVPAVAIIFQLPTSLQLPLQNLVCCFYTLLVAFLTRPTGAGQPAPDHIP